MREEILQHENSSPIEGGLRGGAPRGAAFWMLGIGVAGMEELDDLKAAAVHVEMDVALVEVRRAGLPDAGFRVQ